MVYISGGGNVAPRRSICRLSIFSDIFWGVVNFIYFFFQSMFMTEEDIKSSKYYRPPSSSADYGGGGGPGGGPGGGGGRGWRGGNARGRNIRGVGRGPGAMRVQMGG